MSALTIRPETDADHAQIAVVTNAAFVEVEHSDGSEVQIVDKLRQDGDLALSLVAEDGERIVGHVAVSPVTISDGSEDWYGLGPISVLPVHLFWSAREGCSTVSARKVVQLRSDDPACKRPKSKIKIFSK